MIASACKPSTHSRAFNFPAGSKILKTSNRRPISFFPAARFESKGTERRTQEHRANPTSKARPMYGTWNLYEAE
jgi:hypothetical protein